MRLKHGTFSIIAVGLAGAAAGFLSGCSTVKSIFAVDSQPNRAAPIQNPFTAYDSQSKSTHENIILRTKRGDRSVEVELPGGTAEMTDFVLPMSPSFQNDGRNPASVNDPSLDQSYKEKPSSVSDREITNNLPQGTQDNEGKRREVETGLGVMASEDSAPAQDHSYLAAMDHVKQMYKAARYEGALLETDELLRAYPTDAKIYEMRGTLLDRLGRPDLAIKSWNQAVRLDPQNTSLHRFVERKQQQRRVASP